ncbi:hypothetical protein OM427_20540 [Halomonas sp. 18H]|nr:hypothetical protein [Halomonas sp. 18H]MCW4151910.1 hypothetical protein [Halomonas sp. 18H]
MYQDTAAAKKILKNQLYRALMAEGERAKGSAWFATNRFADRKEARKAS